MSPSEQNKNEGFFEKIMNWIKSNTLLTIAIVVTIVVIIMYAMKMPPFAGGAPGLDLSEFN